MFTKNYYKFLTRNLTGLATGDLHGLYIETDGTVGPKYYSTYNSISESLPSYWDEAMSNLKGYDIKSPIQNNSNSSLFSYGTVLGTGTTPPTPDDYTLSGAAITTIVNSYSIKNEIDEDNMGMTKTATYTITNSGDTDITIGEIGIFVERRWQSQTTTGLSPQAYHHGFVMIERSVLEAPVTIPAGGIGQVTYSIRLDFPVE